MTDYGSNLDRLDPLDGDGVASFPSLIELLSGCTDPDEAPANTPPSRDRAAPTGLDAYQAREPGDLSSTPGRIPISAERMKQLRDLGFGAVPIIPPGQAPKSGREITQEQFQTLVSNWGDMQRGVGLQLGGEPKAVESFEQILANGLLGSAGLRDVYGDLFDIEQMNGKPRAADRMSLGANRLELRRKQPGVLGDDVQTGRFDLSDLEALSSFPSGARVDEYSREDLLAHVFSEQLRVREQRMRGESISKKEFEEAHKRATVKGSNTTRTERGAKPIDEQVGTTDAQGRVNEASFLSNGSVIDSFPVVNGDFKR